MLLFKNMGQKQNDVAGKVDVDHDGLGVAIHESMVEFETQVVGGLPVVLSNCYEMYAIDTEKTGEEKHAVLEGVLTEAWGRIKDFFIKIGNKIKAWYDSAIKYLGTIFSSNKSFVEKYGSELEGKNASKFKYSGYKWDDSKGKGWTAKANKAGNEAKSIFDEAVREISASKDAGADNKAFKTDEKKKAIDASIGVRSVSDFKQKMMKDIRGGGVKHDIAGFSAVPVKTMINRITEEKEAISDLKEAMSKLQEDIASYADAVDKCRVEAEKDSAENRSNKMSVVSGAATVAKYRIAYGVAALEVTKSAIKEQISEFSGALRSFARYKPAKEDYNIEGAGEPVTEGASLYDTFMQDM